MSAYPLIATVEETSWHVRKVPMLRIAMPATYLLSSILEVRHYNDGFAGGRAMISMRNSKLFLIAGSSFLTAASALAQGGYNNQPTIGGVIPQCPAGYYWAPNPNISGGVTNGAVAGAGGGGSTGGSCLAVAQKQRSTGKTPTGVTPTPTDSNRNRAPRPTPKNN
jgi:hypothetical protein